MTTKHLDKTLDTGFFGHPMGLQTLFMTEMWERMSYYGMRALLVLYMTASLQEGGLGITVAMAGAIYGLYTGAVYFMGLPGGWLADRLIGGQSSMVWRYNYYAWSYNSCHSCRKFILYWSHICCGRYRFTQAQHRRHCWSTI